MGADGSISDANEMQRREERGKREREEEFN